MMYPVTRPCSRCGAPISEVLKRRTSIEKAGWRSCKACKNKYNRSRRMARRSDVDVLRQRAEKGKRLSRFLRATGRSGTQTGHARPATFRCLVCQAKTTTIVQTKTRLFPYCKAHHAAVTRMLEQTR